MGEKSESCDFRFLAGALWGAFSWPCVASLTSRPNRSWTAVVRAVPARQRACSSRSRAHQLRAEAAPSAEACNARSASKATQQVTIQQSRDAARSWQIGIPSCTGPTPARVVATVRVLQRYWGSVPGRSAMLREYCATRACARLLTADSCFDIDLTDCCSVFSRCDCLVIRACSCKAHPDAHGYLGTAPPFSCKRRALLGEVKLHESCANGTLCCSSSVCGDSDFLAIILTVCCSCRSAFNVAVVACTGRALR